MKSPVVPLNWQDLVAPNHLVVAVIHLAKILQRFIENWVLIHVPRISWRIQLMSKCFKLHFKVDKIIGLTLFNLYQ